MASSTARLLRVFALVLILLLVPAAGAIAQSVTKTFTYGPVVVPGYSVKQQLTYKVDHPATDGFITHMEADVVDPKTGKAVPINRIMLHHIVFANLGDGHTDAAGTQVPVPFYGDGEERDQMQLPPGYGYKSRGSDQWAIVWMLMNHRAQTDSVLIRWRITWDENTNLTAIVPMIFDASHGRQGLVYDVPGGGAPGSVDRRYDSKTVPVNGRVIAGLGHVHGGARGLTVTQPACGDRAIFRSRPTWGLASDAFYKVHPILHEPGPINMSRFTTATGYPVRAGEQLKLTSTYDAHLPHTRVMGLLVVYIAPDATAAAASMRCPTPEDVKILTTARPGRQVAPAFTVPLTGINARGLAVSIARPPGATAWEAGNTQVDINNFAFSQRNLSVPRGATVTWAFNDTVAHDVTLASGPYGFSSSDLKGGKTYSLKLDRPGTYKIFCALHPVQMTQVVQVR